MGLLEILKGEQPGLIRSLLNYKNIGQFGEYSTEFALTNHNLEGNLFVLKNLYLPTMSGTTEIDLLMLHEKGIFVFESKNYSGWIFGEANQRYWTQSLENGTKNQFYNPILQNASHIRAVAKFLDKPVYAFTSFIVFSERCTLKKIPEDTGETVIVRRPDMLKQLRIQLNVRSPIYSFEELQQMADKLRSCTGKSEEEKRRHVDNLKTKCPICGSDLVLRRGKYGPFYGCSAYPKCGYTRKL